MKYKKVINYAISEAIRKDGIFHTSCPPRGNHACELRLDWDGMNPTEFKQKEIEHCVPCWLSWLDENIDKLVIDEDD